MYVLFLKGPDNFSSFIEYFGGAGPGREVARSTRLVDLVPYVDDITHDNWWIRGPGGRVVANNHQDFYRLRSVAKAIRQAEGQE